MIETNIRLVRGGPDLSVELRRAAVDGLDRYIEHLQRACSALRNRHGLAAAPDPERRGGVLVATRRPVPGGRIVQDDLEFQIVDLGEEATPVSLATPSSCEAVRQIIERAALIQALRCGRYWTLDSPRILWEREPFQRRDGIAAYRRFAISAIAIDGVGIGVAVDASTSFLSAESLASYFPLDVVEAERRQRRLAFDRLSGRQDGQKGTLVYETPRGVHSRCYFEEAVPDVTCSTTGRMVVAGRTFESLADYYRGNYPGMVFDPNGPVIRVSFPGLPDTNLVAAERARSRVGNDSLPTDLARVDKIAPDQRRDLVLGFWSSLKRAPLGAVTADLEPGLWQPDPARIRRFAPPTLTFGKGAELSRPTVITQQTVRQHYSDRERKLGQAGCYHTPPAFPRFIHVACPTEAREAADVLASDLATHIKRLTSVKVTCQVVAYDTIAQAVATLRSDPRSHTAVFVLNHEPNAYYEVVHHLDDWRIKRMTSANLVKHRRRLVPGRSGRSEGGGHQDGQRRWEGFVRVNALEIVQLLDAIPYRVPHAGCFDAQLVIDVGRDRRNHALSVLVARDGTDTRSFQLATRVRPKADPQHETINRIVLRDQIVEILLKVVPHSATPLASLLVIRDGACPDPERDAVLEAVAMLKERGKLTADARVDVVELRKDTLNNIRAWEREDDSTTNALEGSVILLDPEQAIVLPTGRATLTQGTAEPYLLQRVLGGAIVDAAESCLDAGSLNWSNPRVAQRWPVALKRTDDELTARAEQEVRRIR